MSEVKKKMFNEPKMWRPLIFSRNTALVTIPKEIRDTLKLVDIYNENQGLYFTYNASLKQITIHVGIEQPKKHKKLNK